MSKISIAPSTRAQAETVVRWLKDEHFNELGGISGFYNNRSIIRQAAKESDMSVMLLGRTIIGFAVYSRYGIDIFEIRSRFRGQGHGRQLAKQIIDGLFASGSTRLVVECVPHESQKFWRSLGFVDLVEKYPMPGKVRLVLHRPVMV